MLKKTNDQTEQNFWIAYADLMAGLLFVFILLIGAIVVKYVLTQSDLRELKVSLKDKESNLERSIVLLSKKEKAMLAINQKLEEIEQKNMYLEFLQEELEGKIEDLEKDSNITKTALEEQIRLSILQAQTKDEEIEKLKEMLDTTTFKFEEANLTLSLKQSELIELNRLLKEQISVREKLAKDLNITRDRIRNLTGIRIHVIKELKEKLGDDISIDSKSGSIRLSSSVLFDIDSYEIKEEAKAKLKKTLMNYLDVLIGDRKIRKNIDKIIIEGHTDSTGNYMYNLDLSQKRAYEVMKLIYSWGRADSKILRKYLSVTGRSYGDLIMKNGAEDKEASRRIEIKFSIANKKAIEEIEKFLESEYK